MSDLEQAAEAVSGTEPVGPVESPVETTDTGVAETEPSPFQDGAFEWEADDGEKRVFQKKGELADFLRHSSMRKSDYESAMERVKRLSGDAEAARKKYETQEQALLESQAMKYHKFLVENPEVASRIKAEMGQAKNPQSLVEQTLDSRLKPFEEKISEWEKAEQERVAGRAREEAYQRLSERYKDFDRKKIESEFNRMRDIPEQDLQYSLFELLYHAARGKEDPAELERKAAEAASRPRRPSVIPSPGQKDDGVDLTKLSDRETREQATAELKKIMGG